MPMSYGDLIWEHLLERLRHLSWRCKGCAHTPVCEEQPNAEPLYCEAILEAAVRGYEKWKTGRRGISPQGDASTVLENLRLNVPEDYSDAIKRWLWLKCSVEEWENRTRLENVEYILIESACRLTVVCDDAEWRMRVAEDALSRYIKDTKDTHGLPNTDRFSNAVQQALIAAPPIGVEQTWPSYEEACDNAGVMLCLDGSEKLYNYLTGKMNKIRKGVE